MLISEAFNAYARDVIAFRNQSAKTEEHHFTACKSLVGFLGDIDICSLEFADVRDWKTSMEKRKLSPITVRGYLIKLRVVFDYLRLQGIKCLPPEQIPLPKRVERVPDVLSPKDVGLLIESTRKPRNKAIIALLYSTGLRVSELCALNISDVKEDYFTVTGKGGVSRICFIDDRSRKLLRIYLSNRRDNDPALFISRQLKKRITPGTVQEVFKYARKKAGFDFPVHPHTMRHSFATNLHLNGAPLYAVKEMMGHKSLETTSIYLHIWDSQLAEIHEKYHSI